MMFFLQSLQNVKNDARFNKKIMQGTKRQAKKGMGESLIGGYLESPLRVCCCENHTHQLTRIGF
jgi:hypothetical protein